MYNFQHKERNSIYFIPFIWINITSYFENLDDNTCRNLNYNNLNKLVIITGIPFFIFCGAKMTITVSDPPAKGTA